MSARVDPNFLHEIKKYGEVNIEACFNCGNCTAICPLSTEATPFPRTNIRLAQLGLRDQLRQSLDPWLCYYCGDCSKTCPRKAEPGEAQMAMRRWLTSQYDWTGLARLFYTSPVAEVGAILLVGALVVWLFVMFAGPMVTDHVALNTFAPVERIHYGDLIMAAFLSFFLLSNIFRMFWFTLIKDAKFKIPFQVYFSEAWNLIVHFVTQKQFEKCDEEQKGFWQKKRWRVHWLLVSGYVLMFALVVGFLPWFQTDNLYPIYHPQRWLGYYATIVLLYGGADILWGRIKKDHQSHRFSHLSDWIFPILLLLTTATGILVHTFRYLDMPLPTYYMYAAHLTILVPMLVLEVPFGKWSHLAYRPFAMYFQAIKEKATSLAANAQPEAYAPAD